METWLWDPRACEYCWQFQMFLCWEKCPNDFFKPQKNFDRGDEKCVETRNVFQLQKRQTTHSVWKSQKKSHSTLRAKRATFTFLVDKSSLKMAKMVNFGEFLKTWILRSNSVTRQVISNSTKISGKCQN